MARGVKWTDEENKILVQAIAANPHNLSEDALSEPEKSTLWSRIKKFLGL